MDVITVWMPFSNFSTRMKYMRKRNSIWIAILILFWTQVPDLTASSDLFTVEEMKKDLEQMWQEIQIHPAFNVFTSKEKFLELYNRQKKLIIKPLDPMGFFIIANPLVAAIGCGHSGLRPPQEFWEDVGPIFFPLKLVFLGNRFYSLRDYEGKDLVPRGAEILSICGFSMDKIKTSLYPLLSSDGFMESGKRYRLEIRFPFLFAYYYGFHESFPIVYRESEKSSKKQVVLDAIDYKTLGMNHELDAERELIPPGPDLNLKILDNIKTAVMTIKTFVYYSEREKFYSFIDTAFERIHKDNIRNIILDLRNNGGGDPFCTAHLLSYLESEPTKYFARVYTGYEKFADPIPLAEKHFIGRLFILINEACFSSTGHLCAVLRSNKIGTFIGSETGATYTCNDAHQMITLKNTQFRLWRARITYEAAAEGLPRNRGIIPDYPVEPLIQDVLLGKDTVLDYTLKLVEKNTVRDQ